MKKEERPMQPGLGRWSISAVGATVAVALIVVALPTQAATRQTGSTLCVGGTGCYATIQEAADASHDGDTIKINPGTFAGGIVIGKSLRLVGAGAAKTIIKGGGPVLTLGTPDASTQPTITVRGVTVTGGVNRTSPKPWFALGGGIYVPESVGSGGGPLLGATVTIAASVISGNRVQPSGTDPNDKPYPGVGWPPCPAGVKCPRAFAGGGGIESGGNLTLIDTTVRDNQAVTDTAFAGGGGIREVFGSLTLKHSTVTHNEAIATRPYGRWPWGAGIILDAGTEKGTVTISDSVISDNASRLTSNYPVGVDIRATGAALDFDDHQHKTITITNTKITGNVNSASDPNGDPLVGDVIFINVGSRLFMRNSTVSGNRITVVAAQAVNEGAVFETDGPATIVNTQIVGNRTTSIGKSGSQVIGGAFTAVLSPSVVLQDSLVARNSVLVSTTRGAATIESSGIFNAAGLRLINTKVIGNTARATGPSGSVQGGGIWNGKFQPQGAPRLVLIGSTVSGNSISGSPHVTLEGAGLFAAVPVKLTRSVIAKNTPDQCHGC